MNNKQDSISNKMPIKFENFASELSLSSPGRMNLIGEHTDYNQGFVLPTAIDKKIYFEFRKNNSSNSCTVYSKTFDALLQFDLNDFSKSTASWENYILGVVNEIEKFGKTLHGFDCIITSELPIGAEVGS